MILLTHILIALSSLVVASIALIVPSRKKLQASYILAVLTLVSGTVLVVSAHAQIMSACLSGIAYLAVISVMIYGASRKLAAVLSKNI